MKISCDMAIDLIPLYKDGAASDDSRHALEEHLESCSECSRIFRRYSHDIYGSPKRSYIEPTKSLEQKYTYIANELNKRHMTNMISMILALSVSVGTAVYLWLKYEKN